MSSYSITMLLTVLRSWMTHSALNIITSNYLASYLSLQQYTSFCLDMNISSTNTDMRMMMGMTKIMMMMIQNMNIC